jgi:hypothetical protein
MEKEVFETYRFLANTYNEQGRHIETNTRFRDWVKECEHDFHERHSSMYALNFYGNSATMRLLQKSCDANPGLLYGMDLYQGNCFDPAHDPNINQKIDKNSQYITVYGIDSAFMLINDIGVPEIDEDKGIWPLTLLIDRDMRDGEIRLSCPDDDDDDESDEVKVPVIPKYVYIS